MFSRVEGRHVAAQGVPMGVPIESIVIGRCYVTEIGQVRRVLEAKNGKVKYESHCRTAHGGLVGRGDDRGRR
jgi:hypothetical protein